MEKEILHVHMFGKFSLTYGDKQISCNGNRSKLIWNILAYLLCHRGEFIAADDLIGIIWKQEKNENPTGAMRTAIHRARTMLSELTDNVLGQFLVSKNGGYMWNPDVEMTIDVDQFDNLLAMIDIAGEKAELDLYLAALELYKGKFLSMQSAEMWVMPVQAYYHNVYEALIDRVILCLEKEGRGKEGIAICRNALEIDPYTEKIYQHLMRLLLVEDERQEVIRVYEEMSKLLLSTFGVMPDQESRALYREALHSVKNGSVVSSEELMEQLCEQGDIQSALICDFDFFKMIYQAQARAIVRNGMVIHTVLLTLKNRSKRDVSAKSLALAMDNLEKHMSMDLRKGDVISRCSSSQFIVMLTSSNYENSCRVCQRFISSFERKYPHSPICIDYFVQALVPSTRS